MQAPKQSAERIYNYEAAISGSSQWADQAHLEERGFGRDGDICYGYGLAAHSRAGAYPVTGTPNIHHITSGRTRGGKGTSSIIPQGLHHQGPLVMLGDKGDQNASILIKARLAMGRKVIVLGDPQLAKKLGITCSGFNALMMLDPESDTFLEDAFADGEATIHEVNSKDAHWTDSAKELIACLEMHVRTCPKHLLPKPKNPRDMAQVRACLNLSRDGFKRLVAGEWKALEDGSFELVKPGMAQSSHEQVCDAANRILSKEIKELSSIISTAQIQTKWLQSRHYADMFSRDDFNLNEEIARGETDFFVLTPIKKAALARKPLRLFLTKVIKAQIESDNSARPPMRIIIDEFLSMIGYMNIIEDNVALVAGDNILFTFVIQSFSQFKKKYESWELFLDNSHLQIISANSQFDCELISKLCGETTIELLTESTAARRAGLASDANYFSANDRIMARALIMPAEIRQKHPALQILILQGCRPVLLYVAPYYLDRRNRDKRGQPLFGIDSKYADRPLPPPIDFTKPGLNILKALEPYVIHKPKGARQ